MNRTEAIVQANLLLAPAIKMLKASVIEALMQDMEEFSFSVDQERQNGLSVALCIAKVKAESQAKAEDD